jgi:hypothetical protein
MSGDSYNNYRGSVNRAASYASKDKTERARAEEERTSRLREATERAAREPPRTRAKAATASADPIDYDLACNVIELPPKEAQEIHIALVDNSGSNTQIATGMRHKAGYMNAVFETVANQSAVATVFFSDHCDGEAGLYQDVGYVMPGARGDKVLRASIARIRHADGGDAPEAIECVLKRAAQFDFGHIPKEKRHLYLVSDQVAHGMGYPGGDDRCPLQVDWKRSVDQVNEAYGTFQVIASGNDRAVFNLQKKFIAPERLRFDLMDFATGGLSDEERCRLVVNGLILLVARNRGIQTVSAFLMLLLEKWMAEPQYGSNTLARAHQQIGDFAKYLEISDEERTQLMSRIFAGIEQK